MTSVGPTGLADEAAETIRQLNYDAATPRYPADVYTVLGSLSILAQRLPQTFRQCVRFLEDELERGRIVAVEGQPFAGKPDNAVFAAALWLDLAAVLAERLRFALDKAQQATAGLAHVGADESPEEP